MFIITSSRVTLEADVSPDVGVVDSEVDGHVLMLLDVALVSVALTAEVKLLRGFDVATEVLSVSFSNRIYSVTISPE